MSGLILTHLTFIGTGLEPASVEFSSRVTLIRGPSDTGKSFIVDAIDFMLGANALKEIPERQGYFTAMLGLTLPTGDHITLSRSVNGGNLGLHLQDLRSGPLPVADLTLAAKHNPRSDTNLSRYLLEQIGLDGKRVRRNAQNATDSLSFRNVAHLCVVDETQMQSEVSPALTGSYVTGTKEISVLKLILQDEDDSGLVATQSNTDRTRLTGAKVEVVDGLLADLQAQLHDEPEASELHQQLSRLNTTIEAQSASIERLTATRDELATARTAAQTEDSLTQQRLADGDALNSRFNLLLQQYDSDLARLEMISEAGTLLGFFEPGTCVFCGAETAHQHLNDLCDGDTTYFSESVQAERQKTSDLRTDLIATLADLQRQRTSLRRHLAQTRTRAADISTRLTEADRALRPHEGGLRDLLATRTAIEKTLGLYEQVSKLERMKRQIADDSKKETAAAASGLDLGALREFSTAMQQRLNAWGIPDADTVRYDRSEQDIVAGDQLRAAHGKGVRAILHAAFTIALLRYCLDRDIPHPGFVVLDSPLVTYRPPDSETTPRTDEAAALDETVVAAFYDDIQRAGDGQIVVMENTDPPRALEADSTDIVFTKTAGVGRYGFFPAPAAQ
ncbi:MAG: hypothetical protein ACLP9Y_13395 [Mycobacterium sp.]